MGNPQILVGQRHDFEDGNYIKVIQIKRRDDGDWVTYYQVSLGHLEKKLSLPIGEFLETFGHLFNLEE